MLLLCDQLNEFRNADGLIYVLSYQIAVRAAYSLLCL